MSDAKYTAAHPAVRAIARRLSLCFQRGGDIPAMSMGKLAEIVSDGLASCESSAVLVPAETMEKVRELCEEIVRSSRYDHYVRRLVPQSEGILSLLAAAQKQGAWES